MKKAPIVIILIAIVVIGVAVYIFLSGKESQNGSAVSTINTGTTNSSTTNSVTNTTIDTNTNTASIPSGSAALFYKESLGTVQERLRSVDVNWETSSSIIVRELPELDQLDAIASYTSPSYSKQSKYPYTSNGRLFLLTDWGSEWASNNSRWNLVEYNPIDGTRSGSDISFSSGNFAVAGNTLYYTTAVTTDSLRGYVTSYGELMAVNLNNSTDTSEVYAFTGYENRGSMFGVGDSLLSLSSDTSTGQRLMTINIFNPATQTFSALYRDLVVNDLTANNVFPGDTALYLIAQEGDTMFVDRYPVDGQPVGLLEIDLEADQQSIYVAEDSGQVLVYVSSKPSSAAAKITKAIIYDLETNEFSELEVGPFSIPVSFTRIGVPFLIL